MHSKHTVQNKRMSETSIIFSKTAMQRTQEEFIDLDHCNMCCLHKWGGGWSFLNLHFPFPGSLRIPCFFRSPGARTQPSDGHVKSQTAVHPKVVEMYNEGKERSTTEKEEGKIGKNSLPAALVANEAKLERNHVKQRTGK